MEADSLPNFFVVKLKLSYLGGCLRGLRAILIPFSSLTQEKIENAAYFINSRFLYRARRVNFRAGWHWLDTNCILDR